MSSLASVAERLGALVSQQLLEALDEAYPLRSHLPSLKDSDREIGVKIGQRRLLDFLKSCHEDATQQRVL